MKKLFLAISIVLAGILLGIFLHEAFHFVFAENVKEVCWVVDREPGQCLFEVRVVQTGLSANEIIPIGITFGAMLVWVGLAIKLKVVE